MEAALIKAGWKDPSVAIIDHLTQHIHPNNNIKVNVSYQSVDEILKFIESYLYFIPLPKKIEGA